MLKRFVILGLTTLALSACDLVGDCNCSPIDREPSPTSFTPTRAAFSEDGHDTVHVGDTLYFDASENRGSTGLWWQYAIDNTISLDLAYDTLVRYENLVYDDGRIGTPMRRIIEFQAQSAGDATLTFVLARYQMKDTQENTTKVFRIHVLPRVLED